MSTQTITIPVDADVANFYRSASEKDKLRMQWIMNLWLKQELFGKPRRSLAEIMDEAGKYAAERGLTEQILQEILDEKPE